jgi:hypothetical protein
MCALTDLPQHFQSLLQLSCHLFILLLKLPHSHLQILRLVANLRQLPSTLSWLLMNTSFVFS